MEWMATITGDHVGYPGFQDLGDFSPGRKILGSKNSHVFRRRIFMVESTIFVLQNITTAALALESNGKELKPFNVSLECWTWDLNHKSARSSDKFDQVS